MAYTVDQFIAAVGAEVAGDNAIVGIGAARRVLGSFSSGAFQFNEEGNAVLAQLEAGVEAPEALRIARAAIAEKRKPASAPASAADVL